MLEQPKRRYRYQEEFSTFQSQFADNLLHELKTWT